MEINSYPTVFALGHRAIEDIFKSPVVVEEKIDGSQFSFGILDGELHIRSKGAVIIPEHPEKMFSQAVATVLELKDQLIPGCVYRCEYLKSPHHNTLSYGRIPAKHLVLFDVSSGIEQYMENWEKIQIAEKLGLEPI